MPARHEGRQAAGGKFAVRAKGAYVFYFVEAFPAALTFKKENNCLLGISASQRNQLPARHEGNLIKPTAFMAIIFAFGEI